MWLVARWPRYEIAAARTFGKPLGRLPLPLAIALVVDDLAALYNARHERGDAPLWEWLTTRDDLFTPPDDAPPAWYLGPDAPPLAIPAEAVNGR